MSKEGLFENIVGFVPAILFWVSTLTGKTSLMIAAGIIFSLYVIVMILFKSIGIAIAVIALKSE